jgi:LPS-assembly protein
VALNIRFIYRYCARSILVGLAINPALNAATLEMEPVRACVIARDEVLTPLTREALSQCLSWQRDDAMPTCQGGYAPILVEPLTDAEGIQIKADEVSFYAEGRSQLSGHVEIRQHARIVNAETAYVYRDAKKNQVTRIELLGEVRLIEPDHLMIARKVTINPLDKSGAIEDVLYRFNLNQKGRVLPAWGRAKFIERFANEDYRLQKTTYSTCPPSQESWHIEASDIYLNTAAASGVAKNAVLHVGDFPVLYAPYLTFPTSNARKSGFLMPLVGYSNVGGFDFAAPYYWNIAPNYDATFTPHMYSSRGLMLGGDFRYLTSHSMGEFSGNVLPQDHAYSEFLSDKKSQFPQLRGDSTDRWSVLLNDTTNFTPNLSMNINFQQVSDDYYPQDFSRNLAILTENQLLRQGDLAYTTDHWLWRGMMQSYQTLHPVNQAPIADIYERLPQLMGYGSYHDLPLGVDFDVLGQYDDFHWPSHTFLAPQGPRYYLNPVVSMPFLKPYGYVTPAVELVQNDYEVRYGDAAHGQSFQHTIPRVSVDSGLTFERTLGGYSQTLEPRLYYMYVPYRNQMTTPVYDSAYMIFNTEQLFRTNRFSGFDRIGDTNQGTYALTSRLMSDSTGEERASVTVGQIRYFSKRRVNLCYSRLGDCVDNPYTLGFLSPEATTSPIASHGVYRFNSIWSVTGDYVYDGSTRSTDNSNLNLHYQPADNRIFSVGYSYLVNGNLLPTAYGGIQNNALHQATVAAASPITDKWSALGIYSYNLSKGYSMLSVLGIQYDNCCWAARLLGGQTFMSLSTNSLQPKYNNNVYFQVLLKGLGTVESSDPSSIIRSYLPGLSNIF